MLVLLGYIDHTLFLVIFLFSLNDRSSHQRGSVTKVSLRNFAKLIGKHLCLSLFLNEVAGLRLFFLK